ncbi:MAG TPA: HIT domain-containing protein [Candidatus Saccharimonadia bacterium]|nr:HIT domain-containing protein [Candidatus Saccharimonadia bacterium]
MSTTFSHEPEGYVCPFCKFLTGSPDKYSSENDIVYRNEFTTAFIAPKWWINNKGHVLVIPNKHYENIYSIPDSQLAEVYKTVKKVATAIRSTYGCEGTSTRQHNEPAGNQDVWHFHAHVYPRYENDKLYHNHDQAAFAETRLRTPYAEKLRTYFAENN